jgi:hypothetical protein
MQDHIFGDRPSFEVIRAELRNLAEIKVANGGCL